MPLPHPNSRRGCQIGYRKATTLSSEFHRPGLHKQCGSQEHPRHFKKLKEKNGKIFLAGLRGPVEEVFKVSGFMSIFRVFATAEAALKEI